MLKISADVMLRESEASAFSAACEKQILRLSLRKGFGYRSLALHYAYFQRNSQRIRSSSLSRLDPASMIFVVKKCLAFTARPLAAV
jgi:hypothetical protein